MLVVIVFVRLVVILFVEWWLFGLVVLGFFV